MTTGENDQGLRVIADMIRKGGILVLGLHFYFFCYIAFKEWGLTIDFIERILLGIARTGLFAHFYISKVIAVGLLALSQLGNLGKKDEKITRSSVTGLLVSGLIIYFATGLVFYLSLPFKVTTLIYIPFTTIGFLLVVSGTAKLSRLLKLNMSKDIFNEENETFPQEERLLDNEYSINLRAWYKLKGKVRQSYVNIINPFRALLVAGTPGAGKSYFIIRHIITQQIRKGFTMFCYDFKFDDLSRIVYNTLLNNPGGYKKVPGFFVINFDDLSRTHRCNPLDARTMFDITDAAEASRSILLGLNRDWVKKTGDFFVESPINFVTAIIWFLKKYQNGKYCTLPHVIELMQASYDDLFPVLGTEPEIEVLINPFISAYMNRAMEQLEGQIASAKIGMARLASPQLYYVLSGNDFTLDINNPDDPKIVCCGNNPLKIQIYGAVLSLYINRMLKLVNRKNQLKCSILFDEYPTIYCPLDTTVATGRSNLVATTIAVQSIEQVRMDYSREQAEVLVNICGNVIVGQSSGDTAKLMSERIGKIVQERESVSINRTDTSMSRNTQLDYAVPASRISNLSSGEFVGTVADTPDQEIKLKAFHSNFINDHEALKAEEKAYKPIPRFRDVTPLEVQNNFITIKNDVTDIIESELERIKNDPNLSHLLFVKK